ncbi:endonuclease/exonuclease/phosphatase family protein [Cardiosporidium cionae]|uniref:Endonuclease/exonuclease/phosphatase family protein n=1 Tax=Cardiosporidium cionae TaxID=476202 RepID=A0ABQ7JA28_9APIC|nr:endonuclease/exonuclease/phosphatase family protein [Cardiosporidium cionae]|eukprot:KAF8820858.1 endonuclease/exonuclease/phosphatase family protein [Cardiosporidium cionae]
MVMTPSFQMDQLIQQNSWQESSKEVDTLTLLSFNTGLLEYTLFGAKLYQNPPFTQQRLLQLPAALLSSGADILALQELYDAKHVAFVIERVSSSYPFCGRVDTGSRIALHNGLMILSKYPIICSRFHPHTEVTPIEWFFGSKGILEVSVDIPGLGIVTFLNIHMASGAVDPESTYVEAVRNREILQLLKICSDAGQRGEIPVVIGDLNADPELCASNYKTFLEDGWIDSWLFSSSHMDPYSFILRGFLAASTSGKASFIPNRSRVIATEAKRIRDLTYWLINTPHPSPLDFMDEIMTHSTLVPFTEAIQTPTPSMPSFPIASPPMLWYASALMDDILHHCYHHSYRQQRYCLATIHAFREEFHALLSGKRRASRHCRNNSGHTFMTTVSDASQGPITLFTPDLCEPLIDIYSHVSPLSRKVSDACGPRQRPHPAKSLRALASAPSIITLTKALSMFGGSNITSLASYESPMGMKGDTQASTKGPIITSSLLPCRVSLPSGVYTSNLEGVNHDKFAPNRDTMKGVPQRSSLSFSSVTWDPQNPLNAIGPHRHCHGLRCDYIFLPPPRFAQQLCHFIPFNAAVLFQTPHVALRAGQCCKAVEKVTISDHYAVFVELRRRQSFQAL